jgi:small multidrug resistance pump
MNVNFKTWFLSFFVIVFGVGGNALLSKGVTLQGPHASLFSLLTSPLVILGILTLMAWMVFRMALLSISPMSAMLPLVAGAGYVLITLVGHFILGEEVGAARYLGVAFITLGVVLIASSTMKKDTGGVHQ